MQIILHKTIQKSEISFSWNVHRPKAMNRKKMKHLRSLGDGANVITYVREWFKSKISTHESLTSSFPESNGRHSG